MAYQPGSIANLKTTQSQSNYVPGSIASKSLQQTSSTYRPGSIAGSSTSSGSSTKTAQGLYNLAVQSGFKDEADRLLGNLQGEQTNKFWSGGFIMDTIDTLNALQYGVTGLLKGKSFIQGIRERSSFTDEDALGDKGLPGAIAGVLLDIVADPLTYIAPATIVKRVPLLSKVLKAGKEAVFGKTVDRVIQETPEALQAAEAAGKSLLPRTYQTQEGGTAIGRWTMEKLAYSLGSDPIFRETIERGTKNAAITTQKIANLATDLSGLSDDVASKFFKTIDDQGRIGLRPLSEVRKLLTPQQVPAVAKLYNTIESLGKEMVDLGLLDKATYEKNLGEYVRQVYREFEEAKKSPFGSSKARISPVKKRVDVLSEERKADRITNPAYVMARTAIEMTRRVENAKLLKQVATRFASDVPQEGFTKMGSGKTLGALADKYIPNHMAEYLNEIVAPAQDTIGRQIIAGFKYAKVILNPATHIRNIMSNEILNYWKLGMNPLDPRTIAAKKEALTEIFRGSGKWIDEATPLGYGLDTFAANELRMLLDSPESLSAFGKSKNLLNTVKNKLGDLYQMEENQAKLTAYIYQRKVKGLKPEDAWKAAESATFNYAQVTPFIRKLRTSIWGMPFITFTYKATPLAIETALKHPGRISVIGKIKKGIESMSDLEETDREKASQPAWVRDGFYIKLPGKDSEGRSKYFDLTYIIPFGDLISGNFFERGMNTETGTPESAGQAIARKNPVSQLIMELGKNRNFYGNKIWRDSDPNDKQARDIFLHIAKTYAPPMLSDQLPNGFNPRSGEREWRGVVGGVGATPENQQRNLTQELIRNLGIKIQPFNVDVQEQYAEWNKKKALETLLQENNVLKKFEQTYIPK